MDENTHISDLTVAEFRKVMRQCLIDREAEVLADRIRAGLSNGYEAGRIQYAKAQEQMRQAQPLKNGFDIIPTDSWATSPKHIPKGTMGEGRTSG